VAYCAALRDRPARSLEHRMTARALRWTALRIRVLAAAAAKLQGEIGRLVRAVAAVAAGTAWDGTDQRRPGAGERSHAGRLRSEAAFAALAGVSLIPASSGLVTRHRLNRGGDRRLNRALHTVALVRLRDDPATRIYAARRRAEGKSPPEIRRCVKRAIARQLFKLLQRYDRSHMEVVQVA
jgi:transposase